MISSRRSFITGLVALVAAPAIVRAGSLMQVKGTILRPPYDGVSIRYISDYLTTQNAKLLQIDVLYGTLNVGDVVRVRLPNDFKVSGHQPLVSEYRELMITG